MLNTVFAVISLIINTVTITMLTYFNLYCKDIFIVCSKKGTPFKKAFLLYKSFLFRTIIMLIFGLFSRVESDCYFSSFAFLAFKRNRGAVLLGNIFYDSKPESRAACFL